MGVGFTWSCMARAVCSKRVSDAVIASLHSVTCPSNSTTCPDSDAT